MSKLQVSMTEPSQSFGARSPAVYNVSHSFKEETFELQLPFFLEGSGPGIEFVDFTGTLQLSDRRAKGDKTRWLPELHWFYINFSDLDLQLCKPCLCGPDANCGCPISLGPVSR